NRLGAADGLGNMARESRQQLQFRQAADASLKLRVTWPAHQDAVEDRDVAVDEHPLPRHRYVVEDRERVLFVIVRAERAVEVAASGVVGLAADELQPLRIARDREAKRVVLFA